MAFKADELEAIVPKNQEVVRVSSKILGCGLTGNLHNGAITEISKKGGWPAVPVPSRQNLR
jgi:hypothetical protein